MSDLNAIKQIVINAGGILLKYYETDYRVEEKKEEKDPVTIADKDVNKYIVSEIKKHFPNDGVLAEESKDDLSRLEHNRIWIIDPLDGTRHYIKKIPEFCVMIGCSEKGKPILGVVYIPLLKQIFYAEKGRGAFVQKLGEKPKQINVSKTKGLDKLNIFVNRSRITPGMELVKKLNFPSPNLIIRGGMTKICYIAKGDADVFISPVQNTLGEWDLCAPEIILREAGGEITDLKGKEIKYNQPEVKRQGILVTNGFLHKKILEKLRSIV